MLCVLWATLSTVASILACSGFYLPYWIQVSSVVTFRRVETKRRFLTPESRKMRSKRRTCDFFSLHWKFYAFRCSSFNPLPLETFFFFLRFIYQHHTTLAIIVPLKRYLARNFCRLYLSNFRFTIVSVRFSGFLRQPRYIKRSIKRKRKRCLSQLEKSSLCIINQLTTASIFALLYLAQTYIHVCRNRIYNCK